MDRDKTKKLKIDYVLILNAVFLSYHHQLAAEKIRVIEIRGN